MIQPSTEGILRPDFKAHVDESRWIAAARQGEPQALEWMFHTYHRPVYSLCYRLLLRADDAEDAAQATFVSAFRGMAGFRGNSSLKTWLYRIAVNQSLDLLKQRRNAPMPLTDEDFADRIPDIEQQAAISGTLSRMRPDQRLVLVLFYWEDLSCEEIAAVTQISLSAAKMRLKRAREEFQKQYGGQP